MDSTTIEARTPWEAIGNPISPAESSLSHWLTLADKRASRPLAREMKKWGLIRSEWAALREIYVARVTSPVALAAALEMTKGGASKLVNRLIKKGLLKKTVGQFDRRCRAIELTAVGNQLVPDLAVLADAADYNLRRKLRRRMCSRLTKALQKIVSTHPRPAQWGYPYWAGRAQEHRDQTLFATIEYPSAMNAGRWSR